MMGHVEIEKAEAMQPGPPQKLVSAGDMRATLASFSSRTCSSLDGFSLMSLRLLHDEGLQVLVLPMQSMETTGRPPVQVAFAKVPLLGQAGASGPSESSRPSCGSGPPPES